MSKLREMKAKHRLATIAVMAYVLVFFLLSLRLIDTVSDDGTLINISGKQRMLSQRIVLLINYMSNNDQYSQDEKVVLQQSINTFKENQDFLFKHKSLPAGVKALYESPLLVDSLSAFTSEANLFIEANGQIQRVHTTHQSAEQILNNLDHVVHVFERAYLKKQRRIKYGIVSLMFVGLAMAVVILQGVFKPIEKTTEAYIDLLRNEKEEASRQKESAEKANQSKMNFLANMSHELRTPLNAILGYAQILKVAPETNPEQIGMVIETERAGRHLLSLIEDILQFNQIEVGKITLSLEPVDISNAIKEAVAMLKPLAENKNIKVTIDLDAAQNIFALADNLRLQQVLLNLFSNAIKYNVENGEIIIVAKLKEDDCYIEIKDTGIGIAEENINKVFEPFERLGMHEQAIPGTGIGLSMVKSLVAAMRGEVNLCSELGKGSVFTVRLSKAGEISKPRDEMKKISNDRLLNDYKKDKVVLYVEDNPINIKLMEKIFSNSFPGVPLLIATNGELGIELAIANSPDLILLDINIPKLDGFQVLERLKNEQQTKEIPVVAVSAYAMKREVDEAMHAGFNNYITKPFDIEEMKAVVTKYIRT